MAAGQNGAGCLVQPGTAPASRRVVEHAVDTCIDRLAQARKISQLNGAVLAILSCQAGNTLKARG